MAPSSVLHSCAVLVHLSRGHRVSPLTVGRLCVLALYLCGTDGIMNVSFVFRSRGVCVCYLD